MKAALPCSDMTCPFSSGLCDGARQRGTLAFVPVTHKSTPPPPRTHERLLTHTQITPGSPTTSCLLPPQPSCRSLLQKKCNEQLRKRAAGGFTPLQSYSHTFTVESQRQPSLFSLQVEFNEWSKSQARARTLAGCARVRIPSHMPESCFSFRVMHASVVKTTWLRLRAFYS